MVGPEDLSAPLPGAEVREPHFRQHGSILHTHLDGTYKSLGSFYHCPALGSKTQSRVLCLTVQ